MSKINPIGPVIPIQPELPKRPKPQPKPKASMRIEYYRTRIITLMNEIEVKHNRHNRKESFECRFPILTERIWAAIDDNDENKLMLLTEELNKLSDAF